MSFDFQLIKLRVAKVLHPALTEAEHFKQLSLLFISARPDYHPRIPCVLPYLHWKVHLHSG